VHLPGDQIRRHRPAAAVGHMGDVEPAALLSSAQERWVVEPTPAEPYCSFPAFAFA